MHTTKWNDRIRSAVYDIFLVFSEIIYLEYNCHSTTYRNWECASMHSAHDIAWCKSLAVLSLLQIMQLLFMDFKNYMYLIDIIFLHHQNVYKFFAWLIHQTTDNGANTISRRVDCFKKRMWAIDSIFSRANVISRLFCRRLISHVLQTCVQECSMLLWQACLTVKWACPSTVLSHCGSNNWYRGLALLSRLCVCCCQQLLLLESVLSSLHMRKCVNK